MNIGNLRCLDHAVSLDGFADIIPPPTPYSGEGILVAGLEPLSDGATKNDIHHQEVLEVGFKRLDFSFHVWFVLLDIGRHLTFNEK